LCAEEHKAMGVYYELGQAEKVAVDAEHKPCEPIAPLFGISPVSSAKPPLKLALYKEPLLLPLLFRTYSARIYSIGTNSSLACLHMPHLSKEFDDTAAASYNREHIVELARDFEDVRRAFW
jgi:hypothetical protein